MKRSSFVQRRSAAFKVQEGDYEGEYISNYIPHGEGKITFSNQDSYIGSWRGGVATGKGFMSGIDMDGKIYKYIGNFINFQMQGNGTFYFHNGDTYEGQLLNNLFHGNGTYKWSNGDHFQGMWKYGNRNGPGILASLF